LLAFLWLLYLREKVKSGSISLQGLVGIRSCFSLQLLWRSAGIGGGVVAIIV